MARIRLTLLVLLAVGIGFVLLMHVGHPVYAQQQRITQNPRLTIMLVGVLDREKAGIRAAFV